MNKYRYKKKSKRDIILASLISIFIHFLFVLLLFFNPDLLNLQTTKVKKPEKHYIEITEFSVPKEEETEPPKKSKLLAERDHKAKKESTRDKKTRLSRKIISKPNLSKKPAVAKKPKMQPEKKSGTISNDVFESHKLSSLPKEKWLKNKNERPKKNSNEIEKEFTQNTPGNTASPYLSKLPPQLGAKHVEAKEDTVDLNTTHFKYHSYFNSLEKQIEGVWHYPKEAQLRGEHGNLNLIFTISSNGDLKNVKILRSSGYSSLDNEAVRAIRVASPYHPFPKSWGGLERLNIRASFEYLSPRFFIVR